MPTIAAALMTLILFAQTQPADRPSPDPAAIGVEAATMAYLDTIPADNRARSDAYFEGGYWPEDTVRAGASAASRMPRHCR